MNDQPQTSETDLPELDERTAAELNARSEELNARAATEAEPAFEPWSRERIDEAVVRRQWQTELAVVQANLEKAQSDLALAKIADRLAVAGDLGHPGQHQKHAKQAAQRIRILKETWHELQNEKPLPGGEGLEIVTGIVIPE